MTTYKVTAWKVVYGDRRPAPFAGWEYVKKKLGEIEVESLSSDDAEWEARRAFPSATMVSVEEIGHDGIELVCVNNFAV